MVEVKFFNATWCGPCKQMKPQMDRLVKAGYPVEFIDIDESPTLVINGNSLVGYRDKSQIKEAVGG